ncbi:MAG: DUF882 domain-containing protein [Betaproteobacteria bacterium]|nr:DUF882 domain-containing protein [Betaproteobacteria bacterium]MDE2622261.1 DUF882 domain-containing protein [Betaproteobacteria bacterium]
MDSPGGRRRSFLAQGAGMLALATLGAKGSSAAAPAERILSFHNLHTGESLQAPYWVQGQYVPETLGAIDHLLRDHRTGDVMPIDRSLLDLVYAITSRLDARGPVQVISGYRSPATNRALHARSNGVASHSLHMEGRAIDLRLDGRDLSLLRDTARALHGGGVGFYPQSGFVHVDTGRLRSWTGA